MKDIIKKYAGNRGNLNYIKNKEGRIIQIIYEIKINSTITAELAVIFKHHNKFIWKIKSNPYVENWTSQYQGGKSDTLKESLKEVCKRGWNE